MTLTQPVVDANVFVAMLTGESGAERWTTSLEGLRMRAPRVARLECAIAISRKVRRGAMSSAQALAAMTTMDTLDVDWVELDNPAIHHAFMLSLAVGHEVMDCLYLALALEAKSPLATADARLALAAARHGVQVIAPSAA
jgi:predicted nucleic acid-binding protein